MAANSCGRSEGAGGNRGSGVFVWARESKEIRKKNTIAKKTRGFFFPLPMELVFHSGKKKAVRFGIARPHGMDGTGIEFLCREGSRFLPII